MGRHNFTATRVRASATALLDRGRLPHPPPWYDIVQDIPPSQALVRPIQARTPRKQQHKHKKPSKMFQPARIVYPEDKLRRQFFADHPWELARPKVVLEDSGNDAKEWDWGTGIMQPGKAVDGESVVQRQFWLLKNAKDPHSPAEKPMLIGPTAAYDQARREFYKERHLEAVARRIAVEEAAATGAYFGKTALDVGMELEDKAWEDWKAWATKEAELAQQMRAAQYGPMEEEADPEVAAEELGAFEEEMKGSLGSMEKGTGKDGTAEDIKASGKNRRT